MKSKVVYLDYHKAKIVNREKFFEANDAMSITHKMLQGTPIVISIEGTLIEADTLINILHNRNDFKYVENFLSCLRSPSTMVPKLITFKWKR